MAGAVNVEPLRLQGRTPVYPFEHHGDQLFPIPLRFESLPSQIIKPSPPKGRLGFIGWGGRIRRDQLCYPPAT